MAHENTPEQIPAFDPWDTGTRVYGDVRASLPTQSDNFDRLIANPLVDLVDVAGEKQFTPERLRYFKDGTRVFLQYGSDATFTETDQGHQLTPGGGQTLTLQTAEKAAYQVGYDIWPTQSYRVIGALDTGDVVGGGYGDIDLANFDPATTTYSGTAADGYFWYHTADTGVNQILLAMVQSGTVVNSTTVDLPSPADEFKILEQQLNWYAVGPSRYKQISTDVANRPLDPQVNEIIGAVANDDGKGPAAGSNRQTFAIHQASGNSGLEAEFGSVAIRAPGPAAPNFKAKGHEMELNNNNTNENTYEVVGAIRIDQSREDTKLRIPDLAVPTTPGNSTSHTHVLLMAVDPANTNADASTFTPPQEHSESNSIVRQLEDDTLTGPVEDDANTDSTGATTAQTMTNPGGFQLARASVNVEGTGSNTNIAEVKSAGNRELYPGDIGLILVRSDTAGAFKVDILTEQNS